MNTTTHPVAPEEVMAYVDGELASIWGQFVAEHIAGCDQCGRIAAQVRSGSEGLRSWQVEAMPGRMERKIHSAASAAGKATSGSSIAGLLWRERPRWQRWGLGFAGIAAALLLLLMRQGSMRSPAAASKSVRLVAEPSAQLGDESARTHSREQAPEFYKRALEAREREAMNSSLTVDGVLGGTVGKLVPPLTPVTVADSNGEFHGLGDRAPMAFSPAPMIARTVSLTVVGKDFAASRATLDAILARHHSHAAELTASTPENSARSLQASLRVPATELSATTAELKSLGSVQNETQSGEEVTQQHADLVARLKNSRETERRLQAILTQRTGKISDVLQVEREIARVRGEIEQMEAEQSTLEHRVDFATVNLQVTEEYKARLVSPTPSVSTRMHNALVAGYQKAAETILGFALFIVEFGPTLVTWLVIVALPVVLLWRRYRRVVATV